MSVLPLFAYKRDISIFMRYRDRCPAGAQRPESRAGEIQDVFLFSFLPLFENLDVFIKNIRNFMNFRLAPTVDANVISRNTTIR
jgi:hypothetical protein